MTLYTANCTQLSSYSRKKHIFHIGKYAHLCSCQELNMRICLSLLKYKGGASSLLAWLAERVKKHLVKPQMVLFRFTVTGKQSLSLIEVRASFSSLCAKLC